jgi:hypothetical protein
MTWAEDRATRGRDPSAVPGAKTGDGTRRRPVSVVSGIGPKAINPRGSGGGSPSRGNGCFLGCGLSSCGVCAEGVASGSRSLVAGSIAAVLVGCGRTPSHPFVNWPAACGRLAIRRRRTGTDWFLTTVPPTPGRLNQANAGNCGSPGRERTVPVHGPPQTGQAPRGSEAFASLRCCRAFDERRESDHQELLECVRVFERRPVGNGSDYAPAAMAARRSFFRGGPPH